MFDSHFESAAQLYCPFVTSLNPEYARIAARSRTWALRCGLLSPSASSEKYDEYARLAALVHPHADISSLQIVADWFAWKFLVDDVWDESNAGRQVAQMTQMHRRFAAILHGEPAQTSDHPFTHALADLCARIRARDPGGVFDRFSAATEAVFRASQWEAANRRRGSTPDLATYMAKRIETGGVYPCFALIALTHNLTLPAAVYADDTVRRLSLLANRLICWSNDISSLAKEIRQGDVHNLVIVIQAEHGISLSEAFIRACEIHDADARSFVELAEQLPRLGDLDAQLARYVEGLQTWIAANLCFSLTAERYKLRPLDMV
jgi:hypothetical protein